MVVAKIRKNTLNQGTSIALIYLLVALTQSIDRLYKLLFLVDVKGQLPIPLTMELASGGANEKQAISPRGTLLGTIDTLGDLLCLPIDIRHIAFSAANFATALV